MELCKQNGVWFYRSELLPCPHGFATRIGGVSKEAHTKSLNLAFGRGDGDAVVLENLERFARAVGVSADSVVSLPQVHGSNVLSVSHIDRGEGYFRKSERVSDGYVTSDRAVSIGVKTADCVPILLCGLSDGGIPLAVSALHAGWRGTAARIAEKGVLALVSLGIRRENIRAAIGPAICASCYEVDADFRETFIAAFGEVFLENTFFARRESAGKYTSDLREINRRILCSAGVSPPSIDVSSECTSCRPDLFFSHRYSHGVRGTMLSLIALPSEM